MKSARNMLSKLLNQETGVSLVLVAILLVLFIAFVAFAIDVAHLFVVRNELHNASDAGALAGARQLLNPDGVTIDPNANQAAFDAATDNSSENVSVDVNWVAPQNDGTDIERGHWSFTNQTFTANGNLTQKANWQTTSTAVLDVSPDFINAVRVCTRRERTQAQSFFARILGFMGFDASAESVAYIGFSGKLNPTEADGPIIICKDSIINFGNDVYTCTIGRMINSSGNTSTANTGAWTDFSQEPCGNPSAGVRNLVCSGGNPNPIVFGEGIGANNGEIQTAYSALADCWKTGLHLDTDNDGTPDHNLDTDGDGYPDRPWAMTLPVVDCGEPGGPINQCPVVVGAVNVNVIWMTSAISSSGSDPQFNNIPRSMTNPNTGTAWTCPDTSTEALRRACWADFVNTFNLKNLTDQGDTPVTDADYAQKSIYFLPDCTPHVPSGVTGGENFGILAKIPVLVH